MNDKLINENYYDVIIVGAGPGGYETALYGASQNLKVLLIEKNKLGGVCLNCGCIPTKTYYTAAKYINNKDKELSFGLTNNTSFDYTVLKEYKEKTIQTLQDGISFLLKKANVTLINGEAKLVNTNSVDVNGLIYKGKNIIIATGARPFDKYIQGIEYTIDSTKLLKLDTIPKSLTIIGGGVIGIEMASIYSKFGTKVEVVEMCNNILPNFDLEVSKRLLAYLKKSGIKFHLSSKVLEVSESKTVKVFENNQEINISSEEVLVAIGRIPNTLNLGLDEVKIDYNDKGIIVNKDFCTNVPNIYAIGDVQGTNMLAHVASYSGKYVIDKITKQMNNTNFDIIPSAVFTFPELACVGLTEEDCKKQGLEYLVKKSYYKASGKALAMNETDGFVKSIICNNHLVGVHILGEEASTMIHEATLIINKDISLTEVKNYIYAHPTLSEIFKETI